MAHNITIDDLAVIIKDEFEKTGKHFDKLEKGQKNLEQGQKNLEHGHEDIKLKLSNVAYRFELQELENTVKDMQKEIGLLKQKMAAS